MTARSQPRLLLLAVLCAAVLLPRLSGPYLQLCWDGADPPVELHMSAWVAGDLQSGTAHNDEDQIVDLSQLSAGKVWPPSLDGALFLIFLVMLVSPRRTSLLPLLRTIRVPESALFLRPPLRGPPT
jgi:hypothetical protein